MTIRWWIGFVIVFACSSTQVQAQDSSDGSRPNAENVTPPDRARVTTITLRNWGHADANKLPVTFGHVFKSGDVPKGFSLRAIRASGNEVPIQVDAKATHPDGSLRHAVITLLPPRFDAKTPFAVDLVKRSATATESQPAGPSAALLRDIDADVVLSIDGERYFASARELLAAKNQSTWLNGPLVTEWRLAAAFKDKTGNPHPHLALKSALRVYRSGELRFDVAVENGWAFAPAPQDYRYDVQVKFGDEVAYEKLNLLHHHLSRWRKVLWRGVEPKVLVNQDMRYLIETRAIPAYDLRVKISQQTLDTYAKALAAGDFGPMGSGLSTKAMATTGGRPEIGPLPGWAAAQIVSQDPVATATTLAMGNLSGSWPIHYRDPKTDLPVTLDDFPYMTLLGTPDSAINKATGKSEWFPSCEGRCKTPFRPDSAHQPSYAYLPYLISGDYYYLEELFFWASWNLLEMAPPYRSYTEGLLKPGQVRAQAWSLRTLAQAAYIAPDSHPLKPYFIRRVKNNLAWYNKNFTDNEDANKLGVLTIGYAITSNDGTALAPWQDDFFTWAVGYVWGLGFSDALPLLLWKSKFPVGRMIDPDYCWIFASEFVVTVRKNKNSERLFENLGEAYQATVANRINSKGVRLGDLSCASRDMADWLSTKWNDAKPGSARVVPSEMVGYAYSPEGFPAILQPALAAAVDANAPGAAQAWRRFQSRAVLPDYGESAQFAVVPLRPLNK